MKSKGERGERTGEASVDQFVELVFEDLVTKLSVSATEAQDRGTVEAYLEVCVEFVIVRPVNVVRELETKEDVSVR